MRKVVMVRRRRLSIDSLTAAHLHARGRTTKNEVERAGTSLPPHPTSHSPDDHAYYDLIKNRMSQK